VLLRAIALAVRLDHAPTIDFGLEDVRFLPVLNDTNSVLAMRIDLK
jgi:hypothetical protein